MWRGISLANKTLLLFGGAVVLIVLTALTPSWLRMNALVDEGQLELSRELVAIWERLDAGLEPTPAGAAPAGGAATDGAATAGAARRGDDAEGLRHGGIRAIRLSLEEAREEARADRFLARALERFEGDPAAVDLQSARWSALTREYRYAKAVRDPGDPARLRGVVLLDRRAFPAARQVAVSTIYLLGAGAFVLALAVLVFYFITHRVILSPVRALRETAERVREGDLSIRSEIRTGDEFEELAETFNDMLAEMHRTQDQLRAINRAMDTKLDELAQANRALYEAARLKGEFLASVSHELRTPLNSIIGFADLLLEIANGELAAGDDSTRLAKRIRYLENIGSAARSLLAMITDLLEMARLEAGKTDLSPAPVDLREACEALVGLIHPLAARTGLEVVLEVEPDVPTVETDPRKFHQIIFNFLSNAVKFTPGRDAAGRPGRVTLRAERLPGRGGEGPGAEDRVRVSVIDTGPGIAAEDQERIFEKFQQLDGSHTKGQGGAGLGLAICRELAKVLQCEIQVVSEIGRGSMFSLIMPLRLDPELAAETRLESAFRGALAGRRSWA